MTHLRDTKYAKELVPPAVHPYAGGNEIRLERLWIKDTGKVEIRLSWWKDGRMMQRPADLPEEDLIRLLALGFRQGVLDLANLETLVDLMPGRPRNLAR